jgi:hypothetical protein
VKKIRMACAVGKIRMGPRDFFLRARAGDKPAAGENLGRERRQCGGDFHIFSFFFS